MDKILERYPRLFRWLSVGIVCLVLLSFAKDFAIKISVEIIASKTLGAKVEIRHLALGIVSHKVRIQDLQIHNPPGFPQAVFLVVPEVTVDIDVAQAMKNKLHFPLIVFDLKELKIFRNREGQLNVDELKAVQEQIKLMKDKNHKREPLPEFTIDILKLNIGKVIIEDASKQGPPVVTAYNVGIKNKEIKNINGVPKLISSVLFEALKPTALRSAGMFAATTLAGVGFLPATALGIIVADDTAASELKISYKKTYSEVLKLAKDLGAVKLTEAGAGRITAKIYDADITFTVENKGWVKSKVSIKARKYFLAKVEIASGLLYQLMERLDVGN